MAPADTTQQPLSRWTPSLPSSLIAAWNPFASGDASKSDNDNITQSTTRQSQQHGLTSQNANPSSNSAAFASNASVSRQSSPSRSDIDMFAEPEGASEDSRENSVDGSRRSKRSNRPKTRYSMCHPPPASTTRQKLHRRPRPLLQLHRLSKHKRPLPAFEVIPSANFSVRLTRTITKLWKTKHTLCANDLIVMQAESYGGDEADEEQEERDVIGLICKGRKEDGGRAQIYMANGEEWEAYQTPAGVYEFFSTDEHGLGLTLRWVPKKPKEGKAPKDGSKMFNFSTISPNCRRHPVIASLSKSTLDINDEYGMPDPAGATPLSTPEQSSTILEDAMEDEEGADMHKTEDRLREIITITAIWVTFKEGWSDSFKYDDKDKDATLGSPSKSAASLATPPGSPAQGPSDKRGSVRSVSSSLLRRSGLLSRSNRNSTTSMQEDPDSPKRSASVQRTGRARADSSSTVLVHRAASNRRKNNQHATWRADLLPAEQPIHEASHENLARDAARPAGSSGLGKESAAQPLIPAADDEDDDEDDEEPSDGHETPRAGVRTSDDDDDDEPVEEKESASGSSVSQPVPAQNPQPAPQRRQKKRHLWRRLLCGGGSHDV